MIVDDDEEKEDGDGAWLLFTWVFIKSIVKPILSYHLVLRYQRFLWVYI